MKKSVYVSMTLLLGLLFSKSSFAQEKDAILQGRVATENNLPVESATIGARGTGHPYEFFDQSNFKILASPREAKGLIIPFYVFIAPFDVCGPVEQ